MKYDRYGPHLFLGGTRDGERHKMDALTIEMVRKVPVGPWTSDPEPPRGTELLEDYCRHRIMVGDHTIFVYALDMTDEEVAKKLVTRYVDFFTLVRSPAVSHV
jgi:hypothetical protein